MTVTSSDICTVAIGCALSTVTSWAPLSLRCPAHRLLRFWFKPQQQVIEKIFKWEVSFLFITAPYSLEDFLRNRSWRWVGKTVSINNRRRNYRAHTKSHESAKIFKLHSECGWNGSSRIVFCGIKPTCSSPRTIEMNSTITEQMGWQSENADSMVLASRCT